MLSPAEAKFLGNSTTAVLALQKLIPQVTVIQPPYRCMFVVVQWTTLLSQSTYYQRGLDILVMKKPSVVHIVVTDHYILQWLFGSFCEPPYWLYGPRTECLINLSSMSTQRLAFFPLTPVSRSKVHRHTEIRK